MITTVVTVFIQVAVMATTLVGKRPIKLNVILFAVSTFLIVRMAKASGNVLMPMIIYLIFIGGILMAFMIISAITPSAKIRKMRLRKTLALILVSILIWRAGKKIERSTRSVDEIFRYKTTIIYLPMIGVMMATLIIYFFSIISIVARERRNLRTFRWCR